MLIIIVCIFAGVLAGLFSQVYISYGYTTYVAMVILACLDSAFGGVSAYLNNSFKFNLFITGFVGNAIISVSLVYLGSLLNLDIYLAAVVLFGTRIFQNFAIIRRYVVSDFIINRSEIKRRQK